MSGGHGFLNMQSRRRGLAMRVLLLGALSFLVLLPLAAAKACGQPELNWHYWSLDHREYAVGDGLPFLSPGNDSRINLQFLMLDAASRTITPPRSALESIHDVASTRLFNLSDLNAACGRVPRADG